MQLNDNTWRGKQGHLLIEEKSILVLELSNYTFAEACKEAKHAAPDSVPPKMTLEDIDVYLKIASTKVCRSRSDKSSTLGANKRAVLYESLTSCFKVPLSGFQDLAFDSWGLRMKLPAFCKMLTTDFMAKILEDCLKVLSNKGIEPPKALAIENKAKSGGPQPARKAGATAAAGRKPSGPRPKPSKAPAEKVDLGGFSLPDGTKLIPRKRKPGVATPDEGRDTKKQKKKGGSFRSSPITVPSDPEEEEEEEGSQREFGRADNSQSAAASGTRKRSGFLEEEEEEEEEEMRGGEGEMEEVGEEEEEPPRPKTARGQYEKRRGAATDYSRFGEEEFGSDWREEHEEEEPETEPEDDDEDNDEEDDDDEEEEEEDTGDEEEGDVGNATAKITRSRAKREIDLPIKKRATRAQLAANNSGGNRRKRHL